MKLNKLIIRQEYILVILLCFALILRLINSDYGLMTTEKFDSLYSNFYDLNSQKHNSVLWTNSSDESQYNGLVFTFEEFLSEYSNDSSNLNNTKKKNYIDIYARATYNKIPFPFPQILFGTFSITANICYRLISNQYYGWNIAYYISGRILSALITSFFILLVYLTLKKHLIKEEYNNNSLLYFIPCLLLALNPPHIAHSHYVTDNVVSSLIDFLFFYFILELNQSLVHARFKLKINTIKISIITASLFGIGIATKPTIFPLVGVLFITILYNIFNNNLKDKGFLFPTIYITSIITLLGTSFYIISMLPIIIGTSNELFDFAFIYNLKHMLGGFNLYSSYSTLEIVSLYIYKVLIMGSGISLFIFGMSGVIVIIKNIINRKASIFQVALACWFFFHVIPASTNSTGLETERNLNIYIMLSLLSGVFINTLLSMNGIIIKKYINYILASSLIIPGLFSIELISIYINNKNLSESSFWLLNNIKRNEGISLVSFTGAFINDPDVIRYSFKNKKDYKLFWPSQRSDWPRQSSRVNFNGSNDMIDFWHQMDEIEKGWKGYSNSWVSYLNKINTNILIVSEEFENRAKLWNDLVLSDIALEKGFDLKKEFPVHKGIVSKYIFNISKFLNKLTRSSKITIYYSSSLTRVTRE